MYPTCTEFVPSLVMKELNLQSLTHASDLSRINAQLVQPPKPLFFQNHRRPSLYSTQSIIVTMTNNQNLTPENISKDLDDGTFQINNLYFCTTVPEPTMRITNPPFSAQGGQALYFSDPNGTKFDWLKRRTPSPKTRRYFRHASNSPNAASGNLNRPAFSQFCLLLANQPCN